MIIWQNGTIVMDCWPLEGKLSFIIIWLQSEICWCSRKGIEFVILRTPMSNYVAGGLYENIIYFGLWSDIFLKLLMYCSTVKHSFLGYLKNKFFNLFLLMLLFCLLEKKKWKWKNIWHSRVEESNKFKPCVFL